jgi:hypothetical protein
MSVRARGPAPVLQTANAAGSRLEAVLAAGMARMALVPTDGLKRGASDITSDDAGLAFPLGEQLNTVMQEKEARDANIGYFTKVPQALMKLLVDELVEQEKTLSIKDEDILQRVERIVKAIRRAYPGMNRLWDNTLRKKIHEYRLQKLPDRVVDWKNKKTPIVRKLAAQAGITPEELDAFLEEPQVDYDDPSADAQKELQDLLKELDEEVVAGDPEWVTRGPLAADPPYPKTVYAVEGKKKFLTIPALEYVYWNVMQPERMDKEEMMRVLSMNKQKLGDKIYWMRHKLIVEVGIEVPDLAKPENATRKLNKAKQVAAAATDEELVAAVDAMVERWKQTDELLLTAADRRQAVKDLAEELTVSQISIWKDLARRHRHYARNKDIEKLLKG